MYVPVTDDENLFFFFPLFHHSINLSLNVLSTEQIELCTIGNDDNGMKNYITFLRQKKIWLKSKISFTDTTVTLTWNGWNGLTNALLFSFRF